MLKSPFDVEAHILQLWEIFRSQFFDVYIPSVFSVLSFWNFHSLEVLSPGMVFYFSSFSFRSDFSLTPSLSNFIKLFISAIMCLITKSFFLFPWAFLFIALHSYFMVYHLSFLFKDIIIILKRFFFHISSLFHQGTLSLGKVHLLASALFKFTFNFWVFLLILFFKNTALPLTVSIIPR